MKIHSCNFCGCVTNKPVVIDEFRSLGCPDCGVPYDGFYDPSPQKKKKVNKRGAISKSLRSSVLCSEDNLTMDHIAPVCRGGKSVKNNLQTLCLSCNQDKGEKEINYIKAI